MTATPPDDQKDIEADVAAYLAEREHIRAVMGRFGSAPATRRERWLNVLFILLVAALVAFDIIRYAAKIDLGLPPSFSVEVGLLLVSIKLIWMLHQQTRVEHFQFWVMSAIEYQVNQLAKDMRSLRDARPEKAEEKGVDHGDR